MVKKGLYGRVFTLEHRRNLSRAMKGRVLSPSCRRKIILTMKRRGVGFKKGYVPWNKGLTGRKFLRHFAGGVHNSVGTKHSAETISRMKKTWKRKFSEGYVHPCIGRPRSCDVVKKQIMTVKRLQRLGIIDIGSGMRGRKKTKKERRAISIALSGDKCHLWNGGTSFEPYAPGFNDNKKNEIKDLYGGMCVVCFKDRRSGVLAVHHIDYDKKNNDELNLVPVHLLGCHSRTNVNRDFWKIYFRDIVRQWKAE